MARYGINDFMDYYYSLEDKKTSSDALMAKPKASTPVVSDSDPYAFMPSFTKAIRQAFGTEEEFVSRYSKKEDLSITDMASRIQAIKDALQSQPEPIAKQRAKPIPLEPEQFIDASMVQDPFQAAQEAERRSRANDYSSLISRAMAKRDEREAEDLSAKKPRARPGSDMTLESTLDSIMESEGGFQQWENDSGNYVGNKLIGTNRGITPIALANARGVDPSTITVEDMKSITDREARDIFITEYYYKPNIDKLPTEIQDTVFDMQINSGRNAIKILQRMVGVKADGVLGEDTIKAVKDAGITRNQYTDARINFYKRIAANNPDKREFLQGWLNRAAKYKD